VDLSAGMLQLARRRQCYDRLHQGDALSALRQEAEASRWASAQNKQGRETEPIRLIVAADVFCYIRELGPVMAGCAAALAEGGILAFTTELCERQGQGEWEGSCMRRSGRWAVTDSHVLSLAEASGLDLVEGGEIDLRLKRYLEVPPTATCNATHTPGYRNQSAQQLASPGRVVLSRRWSCPTAVTTAAEGDGSGGEEGSRSMVAGSVFVFRRRALPVDLRLWLANTAH
jgi:hypothetical protein